jgi:hypothetical protein
MWKHGHVHVDVQYLHVPVDTGSVHVIHSHTHKDTWSQICGYTATHPCGYVIWQLDNATKKISKGFYAKLNLFTWLKNSSVT